MEKDKGQYVYDYLIGKGLTPAAASGVVGNLVAESGLNTTIKGTADNKGSIGIAQWHSERKEGLLNFAKSQGKNYTDLNTQLDYLVYELKQPEYKDALTGLQSAKTPKEAANIFMNKFEKPAEWAKKQSSGKRIGVANAVFNGMPYEGIDYSQDDSPIGYTDYTLGLAPLPGQLAGYRRDVTEEVSNDPFSKLAEKQQEEDFTNEVRQQQQSQQERPQVQPNPLYSAENYQIQQFQPTQYQGQIFSEGFFQEGGITDSTGNNPKRFDELIVDYSNEDTRKKLNNKFLNIHVNSKLGCAAGSLNCLTDYVQPVLNSPSVRSMTQQNTSKYRIPSKDYLDFGNTYVPNTSIDAWEMHDQLAGENLGTNLINPKSKLSYKKNKKGVDMHQIPKELDYKSLPIGTILGQGNSANVYTDPKYGTKSRHAMTIVSYDKRDGEPLVYDYGKIRRLSDDTGIMGAAPINNVTIPKGYEKYTYDYLKNQSKNYTAKLGYDKKTTVNYNSKKPHILAIQEGANEVKTNIGKNYGIPRDAMDKLAYFLPGISNKETGINNNETTTASKVLDNVVGNFLLKPLVKAGQNILTFGENLTKEDAPKKKLYQLEIEAYKKFPKDAVKRKNYERKLREQNDNLQNTEYKSLDSSVGPFAIKNLPQYATNKLNINKGDMYGIMNNNLGELKTGAKAALNVLAENYAKIQKKNPKLSKEELIDLTISSYNNGSKQNDPDYIRYYIKKDSKKLKDNYLEKIKGFNSFQDGGKLKFLQPTDENLSEGYVFPYATLSSERAMSIGGENGEPAYLIPSFKYGKPLGDPIQEFRKTGEHIGGPFKTWQDADKWENEIRHPAVENRQNIMFPQQEFQDGGLKAKADRAYAQEIYDQIRPSDYTSLNNYARYIFSVKRDDYDDARSEEAFKQYLGLNDKPKYLSPSKYAPSIKAKGKEGEYYKVDPELENDIFHSYKDKVKLNEVVPVDEINIKSEWPVGTPLTSDGYVKLDPYDDNIIVGRPMASRARMLGRFTVSRGKDKKGEYLSYSDQYDFPDTFQNKMKGKPYNVYNRIYYKDMKQMGGTISDNEKAFLQEYSNGGTIPVSSNGVYDYPGQEVIVPTNSGRITMKNVNYPILGIDEYGNQQMMQSNGEYQFPGKTIHEIPQTKKKISIKSKLK